MAAPVGTKIRNNVTGNHFEKVADGAWKNSADDIVHTEADGFGYALAIQGLERNYEEPGLYEPVYTLLTEEATS